jgi:phosphopantothenoylcysteine decarboxylase/phosphopantothenate--cysteine ligase
MVTPLSAAALSEAPAHTDLFSADDEGRMGHIRLARETDVVVVAPATANILAKMAAGIADDLASTLLLATDRPILVAPAMNVVMWRHPATQHNLTTLKDRGVALVGPGAGDLACGESGAGRMAEPAEIVTAVATLLGGGRALAGRRALVTSGPTHEPVDPVRYLANRSSGKQGHAIAAALAAAGADTVLISGPTHLPDPPGVEVVWVETAAEMLAAVARTLPADIAVCAAAVADWRIADPSEEKITKDAGETPSLRLVENPDILGHIARHPKHRPTLVIGFAAETTDVVDRAVAKRQRKGCDWIVANDVSPVSGTFGGDHNTVTLVTGDGIDAWPPLSKTEVARRLLDCIRRELGSGS